MVYWAFTRRMLSLELLVESITKVLVLGVGLCFALFTNKMSKLVIVH